MSDCEHHATDAPHFCPPPECPTCDGLGAIWRADDGLIGCPDCGPPMPGPFTDIHTLGIDPGNEQSAYCLLRPDYSVSAFGKLPNPELLDLLTDARDFMSRRPLVAIEMVASYGMPVGREVFEQIADMAVEYRTGARSLRGLFEELITPVLYVVPDDPAVKRVEIASLYTEPVLVRG